MDLTELATALQRASNRADSLSEQRGVERAATCIAATLAGTIPNFNRVAFIHATRGKAYAAHMGAR